MDVGSTRVMFMGVGSTRVKFMGVGSIGVMFMGVGSDRVSNHQHFIQILKCFLPCIHLNLLSVCINVSGVTSIWLIDPLDDGMLKATWYL